MTHETGARLRNYSFEFLFLGAFTTGRYSIWSYDYGVNKPLTGTKEYHTMTRESTKLGLYIAARGIIRTPDLFRGQPFAEFPSSSQFFYKASVPTGTVRLRNSPLSIYDVTLSMET